MELDSISEVKLENLHQEVVAAPAWAEGPIYFVGDVGGSYARLGFARQVAAGRHLKIRYVRFHMHQKDINEVKDFFALILEQVLGSAPGPAPSSVATVDAIAVAVDHAARLAAHPFVARIAYGAITVPGPVVQMRRGGPFNQLKGIADLGEYPTFLFPPGRSCIMNDLVGGAYGLVTVSEEGVLPGCCQLMWEGTLWRPVMGPHVPAGSQLGKGGTLVLAQGTGLGAALIEYDESREEYRVTPLELGSLTVPQGIQSADYLQGLATYLHIEPTLVDEAASVGGKAAAAKDAAGAAGGAPGRLSNLRWEQLVSATALEYNYSASSRAATRRTKRRRSA
ncbi:glucokinase [Strigomonas culicis]|uniref:Glucokinase n=1 Tax=Strigomonas culicis TaxID=28005 RepID=S9UX50_9TRYP|nr:glucokinase [Strigomonas culicis]|eukprot:EPY19066.1 glucokinase [Strigomonas culicis]